MKKRRIIGFVLTVALICSAFFTLTACGDKGNGDDSTKKSDVSETAWYSNLDFGGTTIRVSQSVGKWTNKRDAMDNAEKYTRGPSEAGNTDKVQNMCYDRNKEVANLLNVKVEYKNCTYYYDEIGPKLIDTAAVLSTAPYEFIINDVVAVVSAAIKGYLYNLNDQTEQNYFRFDDPSWYKDYMLGLTMNADRIYAVAGDYFIDMLRSAHCLYMNTENFETYCKAEYETLDDFYEMILGGQWTYDEFSNLITVGWKENASGHATLDDECIGLIAATGGGLHPFCYATDIEMVEKDASGKWVINPHINELQSYAEKLSSIYNNEGTYYYTSDLTAGFADTFTEGRALFLNSYWLGDLETDAFRSMEKKTPIVYPKWHMEQENYKTHVHDAAEIGYVLTNAQNFTVTSAYLQLINEKSVNVMNEYYQYALKYKHNTDSGAVRMIELIHDTISSPFNQFFSTAQVECSVMRIVSGSPINTNVSSTFASNKQTYEENLRNLTQKFGEQ